MPLPLDFSAMLEAAKLLVGMQTFKKDQRRTWQESELKNLKHLLAYLSCYVEALRTCEHVLANTIFTLRSFGLSYKMTEGNRMGVMCMRRSLA